MFMEGKTYNLNDIDVLKEEQAQQLFERGIVDILDDEEYLVDSEHDSALLSEMTVAELKDLANEKDVAHSGLRKAELIEAIEEVL